MKTNVRKLWLESEFRRFRNCSQQSDIFNVCMTKVTAVLVKMGYFYHLKCSFCRWWSVLKLILFCFQEMQSAVADT